MRTLTGALVGAVFGIVGAVGIADAATTVRVLGVEPADMKEKEFNALTAKEFEKDHPGVTVSFDYLENEAFKTKLPTMLQSSLRPHLFHSWGGGVFRDQVASGLLQDVSATVSPVFTGDFAKSTMDTFTIDGKIYGGARSSAAVVIWYNKALAAKAGVDPTGIKTWDDFLAAVKKAKNAGVTPIILCGKDKWPSHFYYGYLALRIAGKEGLEAARLGKDGGFDNPAFVRVGEEFKKLVDLQPFQVGFADATFDKGSGAFGDGKGLFHLMANFGYGMAQRNATDGKGLPDDQMGIIPFPAVSGGKGDASDVFGGIEGWIVANSAPKEAAQFLTYLVGKTAAERSAAAGLFIPAHKTAGQALVNPFFKQISGMIGQAKSFQLYLDQEFGPAVGGAVNDVATDLALGNTTPKEAAARVEEARRMMQ